MKALEQMNNIDRGELLTKLFPEELENLQNTIEKQCAYFLQNETEFRKGWHHSGFFTAEFWYRLVKNAHERINKYQKKLCKRPRWFSDNFFDGHDSLFTIYCLIEYAGEKECDDKLRQAIHLLFGDEKLLSITLNDK